MTSSETGSLIMVAILTVGMIIVRLKARLEANWLPMYWILMLIVSIRIDGSFDYRIILGGLAAALLLRFEFISEGFETLFRTVEFGFFGYVFYRLHQILMPR